ncbi:GL26719 [Drosophila persimilis]|uniref:GL26719 n=1 Tax=Drosophila persimilis TaxID=7234 RepID=B4HCY1_DROPE|nr:GL26719 [Drosophila persimilis]
MPMENGVRARPGELELMLVLGLKVCLGPDLEAKSQRSTAAAEEDLLPWRLRLGVCDIALWMLSGIFWDFEDALAACSLDASHADCKY